MPRKMLRASANQEEGYMLLPLDSKLTISYRNKNGIENIARISPGPKENVFVALFEEDDVDFKIIMENLSMDSRTLCIGVKILRKSYCGFLVSANSRCSLEILTSAGKKLLTFYQPIWKTRKGISFCYCYSSWTES